MKGLCLRTITFIQPVRLKCTRIVKYNYHIFLNTIKNITIVIKNCEKINMTRFEIDGRELEENEDEYLKELFDLPVYNGDYEDIYQYIIGFYSKTLITLHNSQNVDPDLIDVFKRASEYNSLVKFVIED